MRILKWIRNVAGIIFVTLAVVCLGWMLQYKAKENLAPYRLRNHAYAVYQKEGLDGVKKFCDINAPPTESFGYSTWCSVYNNNGTETIHIIVTRKRDANSYVYIYGKDEALQ